MADGKAVAVLVRGDHEVNEIKVKNVLGAENIELADAETAEKVTGAPTGFAGPIGLTVQILVDRAVAGMSSGITGANEKDYHIRNVQPGRHFSLEHTGDFRNAAAGDPCPRCREGSLHFFRGIEVGHIFKLGTRYSEKMSATYLDSSGDEQLMMMGCYGIGISRLLAAIVEQNHDEQGIVWPSAVAPFQVHLIPISAKDETQMKVAGELYRLLLDSGMDVLMDDRDERPGVKFKDSDLIGIPVRIVIGKLAGQGIVEYIERRSGVKSEIVIESVLEHAKTMFASTPGQR